MIGGALAAGIEDEALLRDVELAAKLPVRPCGSAWTCTSAAPRSVPPRLACAPSPARVSVAAGHPQAARRVRRSRLRGAGAPRFAPTPHGRAYRRPCSARRRGTAPPRRPPASRRAWPDRRRPPGVELRHRAELRVPSRSRPRDEHSSSAAAPASTARPRVGRAATRAARGPAASPTAPIASDVVLRPLDQADVAVRLDHLYPTLDELAIRLRPVHRDLRDRRRPVALEPRRLLLTRCDAGARARSRTHARPIQLEARDPIR